ncbi:gliding-associated putative ABC transporter substrate-binding component GldG [Arcticibacter pallidicorallinus]|uniref:Gliding-associated putative ABC transporter substrate-binding component GldG n=1 Tax=Arcticibacter pallidicorallinus TaxID=1259464 RepID=A0A2T0U9R9_9SPHI|nr:gliding motility-associated ABC transporter substrate-binding protein GldG [Arcticibacter pallidicorallinus]PRY54666.1 gliding-associated putative ABC transporter substrate-binding component GldG [Arcticibacter pallidicorallinus]
MVKKRQKDIRNLLGLIAVILILSVISSRYFLRLDLTSDKRFTLSDITKQELVQLDDQMQVFVYLEGDFPGGFKRLRNAVSDLMIDYRSFSGMKLNYAFINPAEGGEEQQASLMQDLSARGLMATNLSVKTEEGFSQKIIFPSALIRYKGREIAVNFLQSRMGASPEEVLNNSIQNLEYAFTSAIRKLKKGGQQNIGFTEGHGELSDLQLADAMGTLQNAYQVGRVDLRDISLQGIEKLSLLIIPKPQTAFTEAEKFKIDYFVGRGGSVLWAIDQVNAELDSLRGQGTQLAFVKSLNLDDMLFRYGLKLNYDLLADMNCAQIPLKVGGDSRGQAQMQMVPWTYYPLFVAVSQHPVVKNIEAVRSEFAGTIDTLALRGVKKEVLLSSSPFSKVLQVPALISLQQVEQEPDPEQFRGQPLITGVAMEGVFPRVFENRAMPEGVTGKISADKALAAKMIVLSDGDILKNQISAQDQSPFPLGFDRFTQQQFGNKTFLMNMVDYLTDDPAIIALRSRELKSYLLDRAKVKSEKSKWQALNVGLPLMLLAGTGLIVHIYRKRKYS